MGDQTIPLMQPPTSGLLIKGRSTGSQLKRVYHLPGVNIASGIDSNLLHTVAGTAAFLQNMFCKWHSLLILVEP